MPASSYARRGPGHHEQHRSAHQRLVQVHRLVSRTRNAPGLCVPWFNCCLDEAKYINWVVIPTVDGLTANEPIPQAQYRSSQEVDVPACK